MQIPGGAVFASRTPRWTLAAVASRGALSSLMLYDLRAVLGELEGGAADQALGRRSPPAADEEHGVERRSPMPELGDVKEKRKGPLGARRGDRRGRGGHRAAHAARARAARAASYDDRRATRRLMPAGGRAGYEPRSCELAERRCVGLVGEDATAVSARRPRAGRRACSSARSPAAATSPSSTPRSAHGFALSLDDGRVERPQSGRERGACVRVVQRRRDLLRPRRRAGRGGPAAGGRARCPQARARRGATPRAARRRGGAAGHVTRSRRRPEDVDAAPQGRAAARLRRARPRRRRRGRPGARRLRREPPPGRDLQLRRPRRRATTARACGSARRSWRAATTASRPGTETLGGHAGFELFDGRPRGRWPRRPRAGR